MDSTTIGTVEQPATGASLPLELSWSGNMADLVRLCLLNAALTVLTLGIYIFWGKTEIRKRLWFSVRVNGEPVEYRGDGLELFIGFLIIATLSAINIVFLLIVSLNISVEDTTALVLYQFMLYALAFFWISAGLYRARGYRLSRTHWRGIGAGLGGSSWRYGWTSLWTLYLVPTLCVSVSWLAFKAGGRPVPTSGVVWTILISVGTLVSIAVLPWRTGVLHRTFVRNASFGDREFTFHGRFGPLYARALKRSISVAVLIIATSSAVTWVVAKRLATAPKIVVSSGFDPSDFGKVFEMLLLDDYLLIVVILFMASVLFAVSTAAYRAALTNYLVNSTRFDSASLRMNMTAGGLTWIYLTNYALTVLSLGILRPVAEAREMRYFVQQLQFGGVIDARTISAVPADRRRSGEGLAQVLEGHGV